MNPDPGAPRLDSAALVTDATGGVLLARSPDGDLRLPTSRTSAESGPRAAAVRAVRASTGLIPRLGGLLVCDWGGQGPGGAVRCVFDGGGISPAAARRRTGDTLFLAPDALARALAPVEARTVLDALRARREGRTVYTEHGRPPPVLAAMDRFGIVPAVQSGGVWEWREEPVPASLPVRQSWVWLFVPDGRVVVYVDVAGLLGLPGGTLEPQDGADAAAAAVREIREETNIAVTPPLYIGHVVDRGVGGPVVARVRMAALATAIGPATVDPATGTVHRRLLVPPGLVPELCGWGPAAGAQARAAVGAVARYGVRSEGVCEEVEDIPAEGLLPSRAGP
ncbi:NUDIX domain-containing protein [Streptomyces xiamenensis]|uniref:NUDIX domain-containing protein n=1 Tax=Streptomyces xiamenensis TaxID=408015 RepID=UPI0037D09212